MKGRDPWFLSVESFPFKTQWPLLDGLVGISINNLNSYIQQFPSCLVHVYNYQGIEITGITEPIVLSRFDVFGTKYYNSRAWSKRLHREPIEKVLPLEQLYTNYTKTHGETYVRDKSTRARWYCQTKFDLFYPEFRDAVHFYLSHFFPDGRPQESLNFGQHVSKMDRYGFCKTLFV